MSREKIKENFNNQAQKETAFQKQDDRAAQLQNEDHQKEYKKRSNQERTGLEDYSNFLDESRNIRIQERFGQLNKNNSQKQLNLDPNGKPKNSSQYLYRKAENEIHTRDKIEQSQKKEEAEKRLDNYLNQAEKKEDHQQQNSHEVKKEFNRAAHSR